MDQQHILVDADGSPIVIGARVTDFRGAEWTPTDWSAPSHPGSTGRVYLADEKGRMREFFPSVIEAKIIARP